MKSLLFGVCQSASVLNDFYAEGRIRYDLMRDPPRRPVRHDNDLAQERSAPVRIVKIMHNQMLAAPRIDRYLIRNTDIHIIHLRRENLFKQHVSNMLNKHRQASRRPAHTTEPVSVATIRIDPRQAMFKMRLSKMLYQWYDKRLSQHPKIEIVYEQMIGSNGLSESATTLACELLGLPSEPLGTDLVKLNPDDLKMIVTNYDEVERVFAGTEFEQYLE